MEEAGTVHHSDISLMGHAQRPEVEWRKNTGGKIRDIQEAIDIARKNGVVIFDDIKIRKVSEKSMPKNTYARYFAKTASDPNTSISWGFTMTILMR